MLPCKLPVDTKTLAFFLISDKIAIMHGKTYPGQAPFQALCMKELTEPSLTVLWYKIIVPIRQMRKLRHRLIK